jgi:hypothetical protein
MVEDIEEAAANASNKMLPADVYKMIDRCMTSLGQKVKTRIQSDATTREKEPERLKQIEVIREQATMLHGCRLNRDKVTEESCKADEGEGDGVHGSRGPGQGGRVRPGHSPAVERARTRNCDPRKPRHASGGPALATQREVVDCLAPLRDAIDQARYTMDAANRELNEPEETVLRGFGKQLGSSRKEIMALSRDLAVGQPASVAAEATRMAREACEVIRASRESIRAALREMGAASDISEVSGPVRSRPALSGGPPMGRRPAVPLPAWPQ